jgi:hypothetical protein
MYLTLPLMVFVWRGAPLRILLGCIAICLIIYGEWDIAETVDEVQSPLGGPELWVSRERSAKVEALLKNQGNRARKFCAGVVQKKIQHLHDTATNSLWIGEPRTVTRETNSG